MEETDVHDIHHGKRKKSVGQGLGSMYPCLIGFWCCTQNGRRWMQACRDEAQADDKMSGSNIFKKWNMHSSQ